MAEFHEDPKNLNEVLNRIHDIALKASSADGIPSEVDRALSDIVALARYKFNVLGGKDQAGSP